MAYGRLTFIATDVDISSPADGQILSYNATTGKWENKTFTAAPVKLSKITDFTILSEEGFYVLLNDAAVKDGDSPQGVYRFVNGDSINHTVSIEDVNASHVEDIVLQPGDAITILFFSSSGYYKM